MKTKSKPAHIAAAFFAFMAYTEQLIIEGRCYYDLPLEDIWLVAAINGLFRAALTYATTFFVVKAFMFLFAKLASILSRASSQSQVSSKDDRSEP